MGKRKIPKLITLDTETYNGLIGDLKRIAIYDGKEITYGYKFSDILPVIENYYKNGFMPHIYIHNMEFDLRKLPEIFKNSNVKWGSCRLINNKFALVSCKKYVIHDSLKLLPMSLQKLSQDFELEHGKLDLWEAVQKEYPGEYKDVVDFLDRCDIDNKLYLEYLGFDVLSLYELIEKLCDVSGLEFSALTKCLTTASMSKKILKEGYKGKAFISTDSKKTDFEILTKNKYWSSELEINHNESIKKVTYIEIENKIREAYTGGRTEVFKPYLKRNRNKIVGYHMDVNSLYPSKMIDNDFPVGFPIFYDEPHEIKQRFEVWLRHRKGLGFLKCKIYIPYCHIPPLPVKAGKLIFPCGHLIGTWTFIEIAHAIEKYNAEITEFIEMIYFPTTYKVFHNFIETFSKMKEKAKEDGNNSLYTFSKLIQNTAYGWTALIRERSALQDLSQYEKYKDKIKYIDDELGYIEYENYVMSDTVQVQIAAYVTSYARLELLKAFEILEDMNAEIYYCDTDSIVSNKKLPPEMLHKSKLGLWDVEQELKEGIFIQPKLYFEENAKNKQNIKFKGVSKETQKTFDRDFILDIYNKLVEGVEEEIRVEENKITLRSINYLLKNEIDFSDYELRDKVLYLKNVQKRDIDYKNNTTKPYFFHSVEEMLESDFSVNIERFKDENGNLFNPIL